MDLIYDQLMEGYGAVTFEAFINLLVGLCPRSVPRRNLMSSHRWTLWKTRLRLLNCVILSEVSLRIR